MVALSDSRVAMASSALMLSPTLTKSSMTGTSEKSPMSGTLTSTMPPPAAAAGAAAATGAAAGAGALAAGAAAAAAPAGPSASAVALEQAKLTVIQESEGVPNATEMIKQLVAGQEAVTKTARGIFAIVDKAGDEPTADLLTQRLTVHEQTAWMLRSLLED